MKNYYYDLDEYSKINNIEISENSLFLFIQHSINNNAKLRTHIDYILSLDSSLEKDDICSECYINSLNIFNKIKNLNIFNIINILNHIKDYHNAMKRKHYKVDIDEDIINTHEDNYDLDKKLIVQDCLKYIKNIDESIEQCIVLHFFENKSYRSIAKILHMDFRTVKWKINNGLQLIKNYNKGLEN